MSPQSPREYLDQHEISREMLRLGVTESQLDAIKFRSRKGAAFDFWSFSYPHDLSENAIPFAKAYCALKWLVLEDPPYSRDKEDAFRLVQDVMNAPLVASAVKARVAQRANSKRGAEERRIYRAADQDRWKLMATDPAISRHESKRKQAELIAKRLGLPAAAVETIRKVI